MLCMTLGLGLLTVLFLGASPLTAANQHAVRNPSTSPFDPAQDGLRTGTQDADVSLASGDVITGHIGRLELVGHIGGEMQAVFAQGDLAYVGEGPRLTILDISDPASPVVLGKAAPWPAVLKDITVHGTYAYVTLGSAGLRIVDVYAARLGLLSRTGPRVPVPGDHIRAHSLPLPRLGGMGDHEPPRQRRRL